MPTFLLSRPRRYILTAVAVLALFAAGALAMPSAQAESVDVQAQAPELVIDQNFPDPEVNKFGDTYYAYATNTGGVNVPVATASSVDGPWTVEDQDALPELGGWAQGGRTWAPDVSERPDGSYLLYYTAHSIDPDRQCLGAATSDSPMGPFEPVGDGPIVCPADLGGAIDASSYSEGDEHYLIYKTDGNAVGLAPGIYLQRTDAAGTSFEGDPVRIMENDQDAERGIIEAPVIVKQGDSYLLFYSGGEYWNGSYFTSYGMSDSLSGPYEKAYRPLMTNGSLNRAVDGPGGADIVQGDDGDHIVFHGHLGGEDQRGVYVADLGWANDRPVVRGSKVRYEAESATLNNCEVRENAAGASQGAVAAKIDYSDSYVEFEVYTPSAGAHTLTVGFANGSGGEAQHSLTVNGDASGEVTYPSTGWDNWEQVDVDADLTAGWNTIRLTHDQAYAELDYLEVA